MWTRRRGLLAISILFSTFLGILMLGTLIGATQGFQSKKYIQTNIPFVLTSNRDRQSQTETTQLSIPFLQEELACDTEPPVLVSPIGGIHLNNLVPDYEIRLVSDTFRYDFEIATDDAFTNIVDSGILVLSSPPVSGTVEGISSYYNLAPDTPHYWHAASICSDQSQGDYSDTQTFRTGSGGEFPSIPVLIAPEDGADVGSTLVLFHIGEVIGAERYIARFFRAPGEPEEDSFRGLSRIGGTIVGGIFDPEETIYWRAKARNSYGWGELSEEHSFTTPPVTATVVIDPVTGATLIPDPGNITIQFPAGAVTETTDLNYRLLPLPNESTVGFRFGGRAFTLEAFDKDNQSVTDFDMPYMITIHYDAYDLIAAGIVNPSDLNLAYWNGQAWENLLPCDGCSININTQTVTVVLSHLTEFALLAPREQPNFSFLPFLIK